MVITAWDGDEAGVIQPNDWALGAHFGGGAGFEGKLREQGFAKAHHLTTQEQVEAARIKDFGTSLWAIGGYGIKGSRSIGRSVVENSHRLRSDLCHCGNSFPLARMRALTSRVTTSDSRKPLWLLCSESRAD